MKPINVHKSLSLTLLAALLLLTACGGPRMPVRPGQSQGAVETPVTVEAAAQAEQAGEYVLAAREYERLARLANSPQKQDFELKAVDALIKAAQVGEARQKLPLIDINQLDPAFLARKRILEAQVLALEGQPEQGLQLLAQAEKTRNLNPVQLAEIYRVRAQAELGLERPWSAVKNLITREKYIVTAEDISRNQQQLWHVLQSQSRTQLKTQRDASQDAVLSGWLDLAITVLDHSYGHQRVSIAVDEWKKTHPLHPASPAFLQALARPVSSIIGRIDRIALLLPLTSDYALAAAAVRDGFMAMDAHNTSPEKPLVRVYDVGADPLQITSFYARAVQEGAQLVVGPLGVEAIDQLVKQPGSLQTPTVLLGHTTQELGDSAKYVFQFGLPPEQEAAQSAERAYLDGHRHAVVLYPDSPWGQRMSVAFNSTWQRLGGIVLIAQAYPPEQGDYSETIKHLLNISQSEQRKETLEGVLKTKLKFEPRPREDVDFIFLAADAKRARLIKPQLNYNRALHLPVYATSHVFTGQGNPVLDVDLDGIMFGDMPWMLVGDGKVQALRQSLQRDWPYAHSQLDRLYALGVDAYAIIPQLNRLRGENSVHFSGVTSGLSLERDGRIHRQLLWAKFRKGVPQLLDTFFRYKGQFEVDDDRQTTQPSKAGT